MMLIISRFNFAPTIVASKKYIRRQEGRIGVGDVFVFTCNLRILEELFLRVGMGV